MPVPYPANVSRPLIADRVRAQAAAFSASDPFAAFAYLQSAGTDTPVVWSLRWRILTAEAQLLQQWFVYETLRGALSFTIELQTEFGLTEYECRFLPGGLLDASEEGAVWSYSAQVEARALIVPEA